MITVGQVAASLRMGNTVVVKPSEYTPLSVLGLIHVFNQVLPADVLHVVPGGVAQQMPMGNGREEQNVLGPLQNKLQYDNPLVGQGQKGCGNSSGDPSESLPREWCAGEGCCGY